MHFHFQRIPAPVIFYIEAFLRITYSLKNPQILPFFGHYQFFDRLNQFY